MRTTITIPDALHARIKAMIAEKGFTTLNEYVLYVIRLDSEEVKKVESHQVDREDGDEDIQPETETVVTFPKQTTVVGDVHVCEGFGCKSRTTRKIVGEGYDEEGCLKEFEKWLCEGHAKLRRSR